MTAEHSGDKRGVGHLKAEDADSVGLAFWIVPSEGHILGDIHGQRRFSH